MRFVTLLKRAQPDGDRRHPKEGLVFTLGGKPGLRTSAPRSCSPRCPVDEEATWNKITSPGLAQFVVRSTDTRRGMAFVWTDESTKRRPVIWADIGELPL